MRQFVHGFHSAHCKIMCISTDILWRVFYILKEPVS